MKMTVGYKLIDEQGAVIQQWGGVWGTFIDPPNPVKLPNGDIVYCAEVGVSYSGYTLVPWEMDEPPPRVPASITRRQCALQLLSMQTITPDEALAMTKYGDMPAAVLAVIDHAVQDGVMTPEQKVLAEIDFAAANYYRSNSLLGMMGLTDEQVDAFFISAASR